MNPPFHPPSVCPSANLSPFHLPHTETRQWGPHPSSVFTTCMPPLGHSLTTGAPVSVFCTSFPACIFFFVQTLLLPTFVFVVTVGDLFPFVATRNPCHPWLESPFSFFLILTSSISSEHNPGLFPLSSAFILLCPASGTTYLGSCRPHDTRSCPNGCGHALYHTSSNQGQSGVLPLFDVIYVPLPPHTISRFHGVLFASGSRVTFFVDINTLFQKGDSILVLIPHLMSDLGRHRRTHHSPLMSLTPLTFDANTFSCYGGSYYATIAVFIIICRRPLNLVGPPLPTLLSLFPAATITTGSEYVPLQNCLLSLSFRP
jgi:hypothetical protein